MLQRGLKEQKELNHCLVLRLEKSERLTEYMQEVCHHLLLTIYCHQNCSTAE